MFNLLNGPYVVPRSTYDPITIISRKMIHICFEDIHVEFHGENNHFMSIIIAKHIFLMGPVMDLG